MAGPLVVAGAVFFGGLIAILILHVLWLKRVLRSERSIFLFHVAFFISFPLLVWAACGRNHAQPIILLIALYGSHACFSLGFLEVWSLTQGSYSLQMLRHIAGGERCDLFADSAAIGRDKFDGRLASLEKIGLIRRMPDHHVALSGAGIAVSAVTALIASVAVTDLRE
jgi:hypothetical protein